MSDGWVKIHRELFGHPIWKNSTPEQKVILVTLISMANHEPNKWEWGGEEFEVKRGQMVTSLDSIADKCGNGVSIRNVRTALQRFEKLEFLTNKSTNKGRLITICNYCKWQDVPSETDKQTDKRVTSNRQAPDKRVTTNKNDKNNKNEKNIYIGVPAEIKDEFMEWAYMREKKRKPLLTKRAVTLALNKLNSLTKNTDKQKELINYAIYRNWESFYPIPDSDKIPKKKEEPKEERRIEAVAMPQETREKMNALGYGNLIGKE